MGRRSTPDGAHGDARRRADAVAAPARRALLDLLLAADGPRTAQELAGALGVHHTAVRQHMLVLRDAGLDAIEAYHPDHDAARTAHYVRQAAALGLLVTGGSDFHGDPDQGRAVGAVGHGDGRKDDRDRRARA